MTLHQTLPIFEVRAKPEGLVGGYASVFNGIDSYGDTIVPGAYAASIAEHSAKRTAPVMLWSHAAASPVGRWERLTEDQRGLFVEGRLNMRTQAGKDAFEHLSAGDITGLSIGFSVPDGGAENLRNGMRALKRIDLHEVSLVAMPADNAARVTGVKATTDRPSTVRQFEESLRALGFTRREAARIAVKGFSGFEPDATTDDEIDIDDQDLRAALLRLQQTTNLFKGTTK